jgi:DNA-binding LacI/PurR family transcriptional regulator
MARPTIADIAERAGVSKGAVSFALNGRPGVSEETRRRILAVADEMNWRPHRAARSLGNSRAGAVGLILSRPARTLGLEPFFGQIVSGLQAGLAEDGTALQLLVVDSSHAPPSRSRVEKSSSIRPVRSFASPGRERPCLVPTLFGGWRRHQFRHHHRQFLC